MAYNNTYQIFGEISLNTDITPQTDILSDIRSIEGITIVTFTPKNDEESAASNRNYVGILSIKFDTYPFTEFDKEVQITALVEKIRKMPAVNYFKPGQVNLLETRLKSLVKEMLLEKKTKRDRCLRIADRKFDKPSAYKSGAVVRCRRGEIWKDIKEEQLDEVRQGLLDYLKQQLPNTPEYVIKDMIYRTIKNANDEENAEVIKGYIDQFKNIKWELKTNFPITMNVFTDNTKKELESRIGGQIKKDVPNDEERLQLQRDKLKSQGISKEPIILFKAKNGKYDLAEGKHRTIEAFKIYPEGFTQPNVYIGLNAPWLNEILTEKQKETLRTWFKRKGAPGKTGGWVDCNSPIRKDGEIVGYKPCGRKKGEERSKYPSCRPTPAGCKDKGTTSGRIAGALVKNGLVIGISSRGMGSLKQMGEVMEVQDDFELLTWDLVSNPSNPDSWMKNGALNESRTTFLDPYSKTNSIITEILCAKGTCPLF